MRTARPHEVGESGETGLVRRWHVRVPTQRAGYRIDGEAPDRPEGREAESHVLKGAIWQDARACLPRSVDH